MALYSHGLDYMDGVTASFYNDDIMVFTPNGKGVILLKGSIALDFAFEIHSEVGCMLSMPASTAGFVR